MTEDIQSFLTRMTQAKNEETTVKAVVSFDPVEKVGELMPFWPEDAASIPTELTRSALFGLPARSRGKRQHLNKVTLASRADVEIIYTGDELCAKDETVWLACLRLGRGLLLGQRIYLNKAVLMREIGLKNTGPNWKTFSARLDRLSAAHFKVRFKRGDKTYSFTTGMLKWGTEEETGEMYVRLDPEGARLFDNLAYQPWEVRLSLDSDVAARLLSYVSGHTQGKPHSVLLEDLRRWCGYPGRLRQFRATCLEALHTLETKDVLIKGSAKITKGAKREIACWVRESSKKAPSSLDMTLV